MSDFHLESLERSFNTLKTDMTLAEFADLAESAALSAEQISAVSFVFDHLRKKKIATTINTILRMSRLPLKNPKTFDGFDFSIVKGKDIDRLRDLQTLASIHSHRNLAFIGPAGTGKTHLAQAFGYECCIHGLKTYFIKMSELRDRFTLARRSGTEARTINGLVKPSCLIIDEVGHCEFDKENTRLFFDLVDRRYNKEGSSNIMFTSNRNPALWKDNFSDDDSLLCSLDRIFDDATVFTLMGESFGGKNLEKISLQTSRVRTSFEAPAS